MELIRGTTPTIEIHVQTEIDFSQISEVWIYIAQNNYITQANEVKIDKKIENVTFDDEHKIMRVTLSQEDTLSLKAKQNGLFQIRLLMMDGTALATNATNVVVNEVYKSGIITPSGE